MIIHRVGLSCSTMICRSTEDQIQENKRKFLFSHSCENWIWWLDVYLCSCLFWELLKSSVKLKTLERWFKFRGVWKYGHLFYEIMYKRVFPFFRNLASKSFGGTFSKSEDPDILASTNILQVSKTWKKLKLIKVKHTYSDMSFSASLIMRTKLYLTLYVPRISILQNISIYRHKMQ
jgi:hypothetical protein